MLRGTPHTILPLHFLKCLILTIVTALFTHIQITAWSELSSKKKLQEYAHNGKKHCPFIECSKLTRSLAFVTSLNRLSSLGIFVLSARNICFPISPAGMILVWNANEEHGTHLFNVHSKNNIFAGCAIFQTNSAINYLKNRK